MPKEQGTRSRIRRMSLMMPAGSPSRFTAHVVFIIYPLPSERVSSVSSICSNQASLVTGSALSL
jgi:hypothetical protein